MIRVVGANPAMDRVSTWPALRLGDVNRASDVVVVPGGKGFNVARAAVRLGTSATAYGFLGGDVGEALRGLPFLGRLLLAGLAVLVVLLPSEVLQQRHVAVFQRIDARLDVWPHAIVQERNARAEHFLQLGGDRLE